MSSLYISQQGGNNAYDGLAPFLVSGSRGPKATIAGALAIAGAGDVMNLGPGTYRERVAFGANNQQLIADPLGLLFTQDVPGRVRITGADANEVPSAGTIINCNAKTGIVIGGYSIDGMLMVDGASDTYCLTGTSAANTTLSYISASGFSGITNAACTQCVALGTTIGFNGCSAILCIGAGVNQYGFYSTVASPRAWTNCLALASSSGFRGNAAANVTTMKNCLALLCSIGFYGDSRNTAIVTSSAQRCQVAANCGNNSYPLDVSSLYYCLCGSATTGTVSGTPIANGEILLDPAMLIRALEAVTCTGVYGLGTTAGAPATDILGRTMKNPPDIGPYSEASNPRTGTNVPQIGRGRLVN